MAGWWPSGRRAASASRDAASGREFPACARGGAIRMRFHRARLLAADSQGGSFRWWDLGTGRELLPIRNCRNPAGSAGLKSHQTALSSVSRNGLGRPVPDRIQFRSLTNAGEPPIDLPAPAGQCTASPLPPTGLRLSPTVSTDRYASGTCQPGRRLLQSRFPVNDRSWMWQIARRPNGCRGH